MPTLQMSNVQIKPGSDCGFATGIVDQAGLDEYQGEVNAFKIRVALDGVHAGLHAYYSIRIDKPEKYEQFDAPKLWDVFGYDKGIRFFLQNELAAAAMFIGQPCGLRIKPRDNDPSKYFASLFKPKMRPPVSADSKARALAKLDGTRVPVQNMQEPPKSGGEYIGPTGLRGSTLPQAEDDLPF